MLKIRPAGEQIGEQYMSYAQEQEISLEYSPAYASQDRSSERLVQELWKMAWTFIFDSKLDLKIWESHMPID